MISIRKSSLIGAGLSALVLVLFSGFQNCAPANFQDAAATENLTSLSTPGPLQTKTVVAGQNDSFPQLKMVFVVDNSYTMERNQVNLSRSFSTMFSAQNQKSLTPFDSSFFLISTAQNSVEAGSSTLTSFINNNLTSLQNLSSSQVIGQRSGSLYGYVPGDVIGYEIQRTQNGGVTEDQYLPTPVSGLSSGAGGLTKFTFEMQKRAQASSSDLEREFQDRIAVLAPNPTALSAKSALDAVVGKESGLCALARVLKHPGNFMKSGDLPVFVVISDENDNDPAGENCVDKQVETKTEIAGRDMCKIKTQPNDQVTVNYQTAVASQLAKCVYSWFTGVNYSYVYPDVTTTKTTVKYFTSRQQCQYLDGQEIAGSCQTVYDSKTGTAFSGDQSAVCGTGLTSLTAAQKTALKLDSVANLAVDASHKVTCTVNTSNKTVTGSVTLKSLGLETVPAVNSACSTAMKAKVQSDKSLTVDGTCTVTSQLKSTQTVTYPSGQTSTTTDCQQLGKDYADNSKQDTNQERVFSAATYSAPVIASMKNASTREDALNSCDDACSLTKTICPSAGSQTVRAFLTAKGSTCAVSKVTPAAVQSNETVASGKCVNSATVQVLSTYSEPATTKTESSIEHVAGTANGKPAMSLLNYISKRSTELFGTAKPIVSVFTSQSNDATTGATRGVAYEQFADQMGGKKFDIKTASYAPALEELSAVITSQLTRSFVIEGMSAASQDIVVSFKAAGQSAFTPVPSSKYKTQGGTLIIDESFVFDLGDSFQVEFR